MASDDGSQRSSASDASPTMESGFAAEDRTAKAAEYNANQLLPTGRKLDQANANLERVISGIECLAGALSRLSEKR